MRLIYTPLIPAILVSLVTPLSALAQSDLYADAVFQAANQTYQPENALGAPDQGYAQFLDRDTSLTLDLGADELGEGNLTLYFQLLNFGAAYRIEFQNDSFETLETKSGTVPLYVSTVDIDYAGTDPYRYIEITSTEEEVWKLDAVMAASVTSAPDDSPQEEIPDAEEPTEEDEDDDSSSAQGLLVKLPDDGDPMTDVDSAVYAIGADGMRHAFPSASVYQSWWDGFEDVELIDPTNLASYALGGNVTVRPGTFLVKITTDPRVYAVEPGGILRWVTSEELAQDLYGSAWADRVIDVPDTYFANYERGEDIISSVFPSGSVAALPEGQVVYIRDATSYTIPGDIFEAMRFQNDFLVSIDPDELDLYVDGGDLDLDANVQFPY